MRVSLKHRERVEAASPDILTELEQLVASIRQGWAVEHTLEGLHKYAVMASAGSGVPPGVTCGYSGTTLPAGGWLWCDGTEYPQTTYPALFAAIGTTWNTGGETAGYFRVPNGKKRALMGADTGFTVGTTGGNFDHVHSGPSHTHPVTVDNESAHTHGVTLTTDGPSGTAEVQTGTGTTVAASNHTHGWDGNSGAGTAHGHTASTTADGTGNTGTANGPYFVGNWIIKY